MPAPNQYLQPTWHRWTLALALVAAVVAVYLPAANFAFISLDDADYVSDNSHVRAGLTWAGAKWAFTTTHACNWHPLTWLSHMADSSLFGLGPRGPHLVNVALHAANALLLLLLLQRLTGSLWRSACVAALFALHPLRVESVAWVSERKDVLSALFFLLTLHSYFNYTTRPQRRVAWYAATLALFALGLLSKPMLVTLPFVLLLLDVWPLGRTTFFRPLWREKIPFLFLSAASCFATYFAQHQGGAVRSLHAFSFFQRLENACIAAAQYLGNTFHPVDLAIFYPHPGDWPATVLATALLTLAALTWLSLRNVATRPFISVGWFWFLGMLVPVIGLVQVGSQSMADRYTYLPSIGLFILLVWGTTALIQNRARLKIAVFAVFGLSLVALALLTRAQLHHWRDGEALFRHTLAVTRENFFAHYNLGSTLLARGRADEAIAQFEKSLALRPSFAEAHVDLGNAWLQKNRPLDALTHYHQAIQLHPRLPNAHYNLGTTLLQLGRLDEAIAALEKAALAQPHSSLPHLNLGTAWFQKNDAARAIEHYQKAVTLQPDLADAHSNLGLLFQQTGQPEQSRTHLDAALKLSPHHANAHFHLGNLLLQQNRPAEAAAHFEQTLVALPTDTDTLNALAIALLQQGNFAAAIVRLETSLRIQPANPRMQANLALALLKTGRSAEAAETARRALDLAVAAGDTALADALRQQFSLP